jgi:hypothetical protein
MVSRLSLRRGLGAAGAAMLLLGAGAAAGGAPPCPTKPTSPGELTIEEMPREWGITLPRIVFCTSDADCGGCTRCRAGYCAEAEGGGETTCMCHAECASVGRKSCDRSTLKPLCPGLCSDAAPSRPLPCGRGDDTVRIERFPGRECVAPATAPAPDLPIASERPAPGRP